MTGLEIAAILAAATTLILGLLGLFGGAAKYIVSMILDAYKRQSELTAEAQDRDLKAKDRIITKLEDRCEKLDRRVEEQAVTIRSQESTISAQMETIRNQSSVLRALGETG